MVDQGSALILRNIDLDSESQFSPFYIQYNLFLLDSDNEWNGTTLNSTSLEYTRSDSLVKFLIQGIGLCLITGLGIAGNLCSIIVLLSKRMRSSISCFLIGLAISDTTILLSTLIMLGLPTLISFEPFNNLGITSIYLKVGYAAPYIYPLSTTGLTGSVAFTIAVTVERYLVVCQPFLARRICTWNRAIQASIFIFIISILYNSTRWFHFACETVPDPVTGEAIGCFLKATELRKNPTYNYYYIFLFYGITHYWFPMGVLIVLNILIYLKIREANANRRTLSASDAKETSLAKMLFIVVAVFIACNGLFSGAILYKLFVWDKPLIPSISGGAVGVFLLVLNSSVNFLIYCVYGEKFREVFFDLAMQPWRRLTRSRNRSDSDLSNASTKGTKTTNTPNQSIQTICDHV